MRFWLIYRKDDAVKNRAYINLYLEYAPLYDMQCELVYVEDIRFGVKDNMPFLIADSPLPDFAVVRTIYPSLTEQLELLGVRCYNSYELSRICNDKAETYRFLSGKGIKMPDTEFIKNEDIPGYLAECKPGTVLKAVDGHGGSQVLLYDGDIKNTLKIMGRSDMVAQMKIGNKNSDLRVYVIGNTPVAAVLRTSNENFRANFSLGGSVRLYTLNEKENAVVRKIIELIHPDFIGIDFLIDDNNELVFNEIEDVVGARMLYKCSEIDVVHEYLKYIKQNENHRRNNEDRH